MREFFDIAIKNEEESRRCLVALKKHLELDEKEQLKQVETKKRESQHLMHILNENNVLKG
jgi:hypothetical protein